MVVSLRVTDSVIVVKKTGHHHTHITQVDQSDGTHILVVDLEDE